jgi:gluconolactonase
VGGIALHAEGGLVISGRNICHVKDGATRLLFTRDDIPGFNDLFTDAQGRVYTGSMLTSPFGDTVGERKLGDCFRIDGEGRATALYGGVSLTNGIGFSPDGRRLYHSDTARGLVLVHEIDSAGRATPLAPIRVEGSPDGLAIDVEGGVWVALYEASVAQRSRPDGSPDARITARAGGHESVLRRRDLRPVRSADNTDDPKRKGSVFRWQRRLWPGPPLARI